MRSLLLLLTLLATPNQLTIQPTDKPKQPFWKDCDAMRPFEKDDSFDYTICTDIHERQWEVLDRMLSRTCTEVTPADKRDDYQHFDCYEKSELLVRRHNGK